MNSEKFMEEAADKKRQTIEAEKSELQFRQSALRKKKDVLQERRDALRLNLYEVKPEDKDQIRLLSIQLNEIEKDLKEINDEYKLNSESLELYSRVLKNRDDTRTGMLGTLFTGIGTGAAIILGRESLKRAYDSDVKGTLVNKKSLDVFNRLNPLRMIMNRLK